MSAAQNWVRLAGCICVLLFIVAGCGKKEIPAAAETAPSPSEKSDLIQTGGKTFLPKFSIGSSKARSAADSDDEDEDEFADDELDMEDDLKFEAPPKGTPEWMVHEATRLRLQAPPDTEDAAVLRANRKERNEQIVALAQQAIGLTHKDKQRERLMVVAVRQLMEARLQLALLGNRADIDALYEDAAALQARDPQSQSAAEGAYALVNFAYSHAKASAKADPRWLQEFARQASHYATNFPREESRSLPLLFAAARSCELHGLTQEATQSYALIRKNFPKSPYAKRVTGILRRLQLPGQSIQLSGPTLTGGNVAIDDLAGRVVLVVFWSTEAKPFEAQLPALLELHRKYTKYGLAVVGVNLDQDATPVNQFVVANKVPWPQIFYPDPEKRGWNNPIASFYGVMEIPAIWLIDPQGVVSSTTLSAEDAEPAIRKLLQARAASR